MKKHFIIKPEVSAEDFTMLDPRLVGMFAHFLTYALDLGLPVTITSMISSETPRVSRSHVEGRAIDVSGKGWSHEQAKLLEGKFNKWYKPIGAISSSTGLSNAIYYHNAGSGWHFHLQVRPFNSKTYASTWDAK